MGIVRKGYASKFLKFAQLGQSNFAPGAVLVARHVVIVGTINEKANSVLTAEPNQLSERRLNGLSVFEPDDDVCVDEASRRRLVRCCAVDALLRGQNEVDHEPRVLDGMVPRNV